MGRFRTRYALLVALPLGLGGASCAPALISQPNETSQAVAALTHSVASLTDRIRILEDSLPLLACGPEMRALFRDIRKECNAGIPSEGEGEPAKGGRRAEVTTCKTEQLAGAITSLERDMDIRSIGPKLVQLLRHEVVYVSDDGKLASARDKRLQLLANERRLPSTRFLAVTAPVHSTQEAELRARAVIDRLIQLGIPEVETIIDGNTERRVRRFDNPWVYRMTVPPQLLKPADRPIPPEPHDPQRAVYIFRTDCQ